MEEHNRLKPEIVVAADPDELYVLAADRFVEVAHASIHKHGRFVVALSGGSTPRGLFRTLSSGAYHPNLHWEDVYFFFVDERNVPPDSDESNFRMANENLFKPLDIRSESIFRWETEKGDPAKVAVDYSQKLIEFFSPSRPVFDLVLLGMGVDGHTASLFPQTEALDNFRDLTIDNFVPKLNAVRLTMTYPLINAGSNLVFLVAGSDKAPMVAEIIDESPDFHAVPSRGIAPPEGELSWFLDRQAASLLAK
jgi:6-phosphogluconolactonase